MRRIGFTSILVVLFSILSLASPGSQAQRNLGVSPPAPSEQRVALVIGNAAYKDAPLRNPSNDAADVAAALRELGWKVTLKTNASQRQMKDAIREFGTDLARGGVGLFYFAGHGIQYRGENYLVPVGANIEREAHVEDETVGARFVLAQMEEARNRVNIVIMDACRNNPYARSFRSVSRGLAQMDAAQGTLVAFATAPGSVATDGDGRNGVYTKHLLRQIRQPGVPAELMFKRVRDGVIEETKDKQTPWESSSLRGADFYFRTAATAPGPAADPAAIELAFWDSVKTSSNRADFEEYLRQYPNGRFAGLARNRIQLSNTQVATAAPSTQTLAPTTVAGDLIKLSISTGGTGGVYYPLGGGLANLLSKYVPGYQATARVTGGSMDNLKLVRSGQSEVAFTMADASWDAYNGQDKFTDGKVAVRTLMALYPNRMHVVTIEGTGINKMADLKGKRVSTGSPGSATEVMAFRLIEAAGLDKDRDMKRERFGVAESVNAIKDKKIDAFFWLGGVPTAAVTDLAATSSINVKLIDHADAVEAMNRKYGPLYARDTIPVKSYGGQDAPNHIASVWNLLVVNASLPDQVAYNIVKTIFDKKDEMIAVHRESQNFDYKYQTNAASPIPFHPGAIRYFAEKGIALR